MARIRTIKPEFWTNEDLSALPEPTHMLAAALLNYADDEGYFNANPALIKAATSPLREPSVSVQDSLKALVKTGYLELFKGSDGKGYGLVVKFDEHQRVNRPTASKIKLLRPITDASVKAHPQLTESSPLEGKGKEQGREGKSSPKGAVTFAKWIESLQGAQAIPADHAVFAYAAKVGIPDDFLALAWLWFERTYGTGGARADRKQKSWPQTFQNAVEGNWPHAWYVEGDTFRLTTVGIQLQREAKAA